MIFKTFTYLTILSFLSLTIVCSCDSTENTTVSNETNSEENLADTSSREELTTNNKKEEEEEENYLIEEQSFRNITIGSKIEDAPNVEKGLLQNGEGDFDVYFIKSNIGEKLGFVIPNFKDESIVGEIVVISPRAKTTKGVQVGMKYSDLETLVDNFEVHGSEVESRTHADDGIFSYRLDAINSSYEVDKNKISKDAKILEIIILPKRN